MYRSYSRLHLLPIDIVVLIRTSLSPAATPFAHVQREENAFQFSPSSLLVVIITRRHHYWSSSLLVAFIDVAVFLDHRQRGTAMASLPWLVATCPGFGCLVFTSKGIQNHDFALCFIPRRSPFMLAWPSIVDFWFSLVE